MRLAPFVILGLVLSAAPAYAQKTKAQCAEAYTSAQEQRLLHHPRASLEHAYVCAAEGCPDWMRTECGQWIREAQAAVPSIVIVLRDAEGQPVIPSGRLVVDGVEVDMATSEQHPTDLDPGEHVVRLDVGDQPPIEVRLLLREGEKSRKVLLTVPRPTSKVDTKQVPATPAGSTRPVPWTVYATGGVAAVGGVVFAAFGASGVSARSALFDCRPNCTQERIDDVSGRFTVANVALGVSLVALAASTLFYVTRPTKSAPAAPSRTVGFSF